MCVCLHARVRERAQCQHQRKHVCNVARFMAHEPVKLLSAELKNYRFTNTCDFEFCTVLFIAKNLARVDLFGRTVLVFVTRKNV